MDTLLYNEYAGLRQERKDLKKKLQEYNRLKRDLSLSEQKLAREENGSVYGKIFRNMWFPFSKEAIGTVFATALTLLVTIFAAGAVPFVLIGGFFCIAVNLIWLPIYIVFSPFMAIYLEATRSKRVKKCRRDYELFRRRVDGFDIDGLNASIGKCDRRIYTIERDNPDFSDKYEGKTSSSPTHTSSSLRETDYYKNAYKKYLDDYTGKSTDTKKSSSLPGYATDVTYDLHPGDY